MYFFYVETHYIDKLDVVALIQGQCVCSTTGKPTRSFATERVSLDSV